MWGLPVELWRVDFVFLLFKKCFNLHPFQPSECQVNKAILIFKETICLHKKKKKKKKSLKKHFAAICQLHSWLEHMYCT